MLNKLAKLREERLQDDEGFTLIELLVVVVIIGILVAIAIPLYLNYRTGAENKAAQSDVRGAVSAVEACIADNGNRVPTTSPNTGVTSASGGNLYMTCLSGSTSGVLSTTATGANQTINISDNVTIKYTYDSVANTYSLLGQFGTSNHKTYTYSSATGKTTTGTQP